jgi:hypothetical protein
LSVAKRARQNKCPITAQKPFKAGWHVDCGAIGQRHYRPNVRHRHQAPAHVIVPDNSQQAAMQEVELLTQYPPDNEQRFHQQDQVGKVLDQLLNACFKFGRPDHAYLEAEVAQGGTQVIVNGDGLRLQKLAVGLLLLMLGARYNGDPVSTVSLKRSTQKPFSYPQAAGRLPHLLALSGHRTHADECPLSGVKQTSQIHPAMSAYDPRADIVRLAVFVG